MLTGGMKKGVDLVYYNLHYVLETKLRIEVNVVSIMKYWSPCECHFFIKK